MVGGVASTIRMFFLKICVERYSAVLRDDGGNGQHLMEVVIIVHLNLNVLKPTIHCHED